MSQRKRLLKLAFIGYNKYRNIFTREGLVLLWNSNSLQTNYFCLIGFGVCQFTRKIWNQSIRKNIKWPTQLYRDVLILQRSKKFKKRNKHIERLWKTISTTKRFSIRIRLHWATWHDTIGQCADWQHKIKIKIKYKIKIHTVHQNFKRHITNHSVVLRIASQRMTGGWHWGVEGGWEDGWGNKRFNKSATYAACRCYATTRWNITPEINVLNIADGTCWSALKVANEWEKFWLAFRGITGVCYFKKVLEANVDMQNLEMHYKWQVLCE